MWGPLEQLIQLQELDLAIAKRGEAVKAIPGQIQALEEKLRESKDALDRAYASVESLQKLRRAKERELEELTYNLKKRQARLFEVKTNEEYSAVLKEIEIHKQKISAVEEEILLLLDRIEETAKAAKASEAELRLQEEELKKAKEAKEMELEELMRELAALREARSAKVQEMEASFLQTYIKLSKSRGGLAVVPVKDGSCTGCHVALRPQFYNEVRRNDRLYTCENCQRVLYYKS